MKNFSTDDPLNFNVPTENDIKIIRRDEVQYTMNRSVEGQSS